MAISKTSYVDIGALQRKEGGSGTSKTSYVDIGALQREEPAAATSIPNKIYQVKQAVNRASTY